MALVKDVENVPLLLLLTEFIIHSACWKRSGKLVLIYFVEVEDSFETESEFLPDQSEIKNIISTLLTGSKPASTQFI